MTRDEFIKLFDGGVLEAIEFETSVLSEVDRKYLPDCAVAVLDRLDSNQGVGEPPPEYWDFMASQMTNQ